MPPLIDNLFPWFGDMVELGGSVLLIIVALAVLIWTLVLERIAYLLWSWPRQRARALALWRQRPQRGAWYSRHFRTLLVARLNRSLRRNTELNRTLIRLSPLLGLLGTVLGMLEVFDAVAATGSSNPRATAAGVSKATVTTLAGMVVAIAGLLATGILDRKLRVESGKLNDLLEAGDDRPAAAERG